MDDKEMIKIFNMTFHNWQALAVVIGCGLLLLTYFGCIAYLAYKLHKSLKK